MEIDRSDYGEHTALMAASSGGRSSNNYQGGYGILGEPSSRKTIRKLDGVYRALDDKQYHEWFEDGFEVRFNCSSDLANKMQEEDPKNIKVGLKVLTPLGNPVTDPDKRVVFQRAVSVDPSTKPTDTWSRFERKKR